MSIFCLHELVEPKFFTVNEEQVVVVYVLNYFPTTKLNASHLDLCHELSDCLISAQSSVLCAKSSDSFISS